MRLLYFVCWILFERSAHCKQLSPVILVPGDGGSRIEARLNKSSHGPYPFCDQRTKDFYVIWVNIASVVHPVPTDCLVENFRLVYNNKTHRTSYPEGVDIRVPGFGGTDSVEWLSDTHLPKLGYYHELAENMVKWGYVRNKTIRGAAYDFRRSPNELEDYYTNLTKLVEETYNMNNNTRVVLLAHSLGNLVILYFLNHQNQEWKDKYIRSFITLGAPWGGSVKALRMIASGDNVNIITVTALKARPMQRSMTSSAFLMPTNQFWNKSEVLIQTPRRNYTVNDYQQLFKDLNFTDGILIREDVEGLVNPLRPPNVEVHCLYGKGLNTTAKWIYEDGAFPDKQPKHLDEDGDQTVNIRSLEGCLPWKHLQKQPFYSKAFQGIGHVDILNHGVSIKYIESVLMNLS